MSEKLTVEPFDGVKTPFIIYHSAYIIHHSAGAVVVVKTEFVKSAAEWFGVWRVRGKFKSLQGAAHRDLLIDTAEGYVVWEEPNRAETPALHIGDSGERYSTLTGVSWLNDQSFIVNHRSGQRMAVFDMRCLDTPRGHFDINHLTDDIAVKEVDELTWEVSVSGCWDCIHSSYRLKKAENETNEYEFQSLGVLRHETKDFCHGVAYDDKGQLCFSIHTGKNPRFKIGEVTYKLPTPWGVRDLCHDAVGKRYVAVAVSANPRRILYEGVKTSLWVCSDLSGRWDCLAVYDNVHSDAVDVWQGNIWIPDQLNDRLIAIDAESGDVKAMYSGDALDFPHGLGISPMGLMAITNYGSSSVTVVDPDRLLATL